MFDMITKYINDIIGYINGFIEKKETADYSKFYNLLILGLIVYAILQLLNVFKININYSI
jgi:hypothetical protein|tara:strand:- start:578 stop:757 length:180 start_codon:yes stop_codon:yes gene_type:complete